MRVLVLTFSTLGGFALGCSARGPSPQLIEQLGKAQALVRDGCYQCLQDALATYAAVASARNAPPDAARGAFDVAVLLTLRAKELGLRDDPPVEVARAWAAKVVRPSVAGLDRLPPAVFLDGLQLVSGELSGLTPEERERERNERRAVWPPDGSLPPARTTLTSALSTDVIAQYLALAIDCEDARARKIVNHQEILSRFPYPLMRYRVALCGIPGMKLDALRQADARWVDTLFFEGRGEMSRFPSPDVGRAAELLALAHDAFPDSVAITLSLANARNALEEHEAALSLFDSVLADYPTHRDAMLGRLLAQSYLKRHYDAVRTASAMIELGTYHMGDAYYWRAWNRYQVHELPSAWSDVEEATKLMVHTAVYTLAGFIAYAQRELDTAIARLDRAYELDRTNCEAVWTEGMVQVDKETWKIAATKFTAAMGCFADDAKAARAEISNIQKTTWADSVKARRTATAQKRAESSDHRHAQSAFNAASSYIRVGNKVQALSCLDIAATHPLLKEKATSLRGTIEKLP